MTSFPRSLARIGLVCVMLGTGFALSACDSMDFMDVFDTKKKLPGERKPVFPEGIPGVQQGVPPELMKGYRDPTLDQPQGQAQGQPQGEQTGTAAEPKPQAEPRKPQVRRVAKPVQPPPAQAQPQPSVSQQAPDAPAATQTQSGSMQSRWPTADQETQQQQSAPAQQSTRQWPASQPQAAWPGTGPPTDRFSR